MDRSSADPFDEGPTVLRARRRITEHPLFHLLLLALTFVTATAAGGLAFSTHGGILAKGGNFRDGLPFSVPLLVILGTHEMGHWLMCRRYGLAATLPYFIPSPFLVPPFFNFAGTFGALIRIKEPIRSKRALFDVGVAGPIAGFVAALPFLVYGVAHPTANTSPIVPGTWLFQYPLIVQWAQTLSGVGRYTSATVHEHPTFMAAWFGLLVTALNLLPLGQLDGGHALRAAVGPRQPVVSTIVLVLCAAAGIVGSPVWIVLPLIAVALMGLRHPPPEDDAQPLDFGRRLVALLCVAIFLLCFTLDPVRQV